MEELEDRLGEVAFLAPGILDPDQDLVLFGLVESLNGACRLEIRNADAKLTEIRFAAELDRHLGATDKVDAEVEPGAEELVGQPGEDDEHGNAQGDLPIGRNGMLVSPMMRMSRSHTQGLHAVSAGSRSCRWSATQRPR